MYILLGKVLCPSCPEHEAKNIPQLQIIHLLPVSIWKSIIFIQEGPTDTSYLHNAELEKAQGQVVSSCTARNRQELEAWSSVSCLDCSFWIPTEGPVFHWVFPPQHTTCDHRLSKPLSPQAVGTPQTQFYDFSKPSAYFVIHNIAAPLHQVSLSGKCVLSLTSCKQVYCIWYGATFSSPFISTLIFSRMAPDTADLSVRFSEEKQNVLGQLFQQEHNSNSSSPIYQLTTTIKIGPSEAHGALPFFCELLAIERLRGPLWLVLYSLQSPPKATAKHRSTWTGLTNLSESQNKADVNMKESYVWGSACRPGWKAGRWKWSVSFTYMCKTL